MCVSLNISFWEKVPSTSHVDVFIIWLGHDKNWLQSIGALCGGSISTMRQRLSLQRKLDNFIVSASYHIEK